MQPPGASHHHHIFLQILQVFLICLVAEASSNAIAQITAKHFHGPAFPSIPLHVPWTFNLSITPYCCPLPFLALPRVSLRDMVTHHSSAIFIALQHLLINTRKHHRSLHSRSALLRSKPWCPKAAQSTAGNQCPLLVWRYSPMKEETWGACSLTVCCRVNPHTLCWVTGEHLPLLSVLPTVSYTNPQKCFLNGLGVSFVDLFCLLQRCYLPTDNLV